MVPYIFLILLPGLASFVAIPKKQHGYSLVIGNGEKIVSHSMALPVFFAILFALVALRDISVGNDTANYEYYFYKYRSCDWRAIISADLDVLYVVLMRVIGIFTDNYQICLAVVAAMTIYPLARLYMEDRRYSYLKIVLFVNMSVFILLFSGMRQWLAMSVGIIAYDMVRQKKPIHFLVAVLVAIGFHHSGFILLPMYPLYHAVLKRKHLLFVIPALVAIYILNEQIFSVLTLFLSNYSNRYSGSMESTGAYTSLILFAIFVVFCYIIPGQDKIDKETSGLRNFLLLAVAIQCFAPLYATAMRMNYYYIMFIPVAVPKCIAAVSKRYTQIAKLANVIMCVFFTLYFLATCYNALISDGGSLHTVPYVPFWGG